MYIYIQTSQCSVTNIPTFQLLPLATTPEPAPRKYLLPIDFFPPRLKKLPLARDPPIPQPDVLPRAHA